MPAFERSEVDAQRLLDGQYVSDTGAHPTVATGAVDPMKTLSLISVDGTKAYTLADGKYRGQRVAIRVITAANTPDGTLTPASFEDGTSIDLDAVNEAAELEWNGTKWRLVYIIGATVN